MSDDAMPNANSLNMKTLKAYNAFILFPWYNLRLVQAKIIFFDDCKTPVSCNRYNIAAENPQNDTITSRLKVKKLNIY